MAFMSKHRIKGYGGFDAPINGISGADLLKQIIMRIDHNNKENLYLESYIPVAKNIILQEQDEADRALWTA